jgi:glycosyltransferase involved in cell wall biosynthesis
VEAKELEMYMKDKINKKTEPVEPLISIIIPCYNGEKFIGDAIDSVINQTYQNWEIIVVDDESTDNSKKIVDKYRTDQRIKYVQHDANKGIAKTKNTGIRLARGDYLAFLDQDDIWLSNKLEMQVNCFKNHHEDVGMICTGMIFTDEKLKSQIIFRGFKDDNQKEMVKSLYLQTTNSSSIMMIKKKCFYRVGFFNEELYGWDDFEMWMRIASQYKIKYIREGLVKKRMHTENVQKLPKVQKEAKKVFDLTIQLHPFLETYRAEKEARIIYSEALTLMKQKEIEKAKLKLKETMKRGHVVAKAFFLFILIFFFGNRAIWVKDRLSVLRNSL